MIDNFWKHLSKTKGFTLIEALVAVMVIGILGFLLSELLSRTFKGSNKTQLIGNIRQSGQSALSVMDQFIRTSDKVICPSPGNRRNYLGVVKNGRFYVFNMLASQTSPSPANGYIEQAECSYDPTDQTSGDCFCAPASKLNIVDLTDRNLQTGVSLDVDINCFSNPASFCPSYFVRKSSPGYKDIVETQFELRPSQQARTTFDNQLGGNNIRFKTSVELR